MRDKPRGNSDWMSRLPDELLDVSLWNLAIPGSHDSMSFCLDLSSPVVESESWFLKVTDRFAPCLIRPCVFRWATTQQAVLSQQCDLGIRFLDLRIARKPKDGSKLFFAHGIYTCITVKEALDELATWLDAHPKEVVIVCCSHFSCLTPRDHTQLVEYIISLFGPKLCPSQDCPTLRSCWSKHQQVIVSYDNPEMVQHHPELWTEIPYWYADSTDPKKVISYLEAQKQKGRPSGFYVSGLNLTENITFVLLHPFQNMRTITTKALAVLLDWVEEQQPGSEVGSVNIICCDFVDVTHFCECVIGLNYKKALLTETQKDTHFECAGETKGEWLVVAASNVLLGCTCILMPEIPETPTLLHFLYFYYDCEFYGYELLDVTHSAVYKMSKLCINMLPIWKPANRVLNCVNMWGQIP